MRHFALFLLLVLAPADAQVYGPPAPLSLLGSNGRPALLDVDADGDLDLVAALNAQPTLVLPGPGVATFQAVVMETPAAPKVTNALVLRVR